MDKFVKCLLCGEILPYDAKVCPVCGADGAYLEPYEPTDGDKAKALGGERFVIIGNGVAGVSAAEAIRESDKKSAVTIISGEGCPAYNRPMLTKLPLREIELMRITYRDETWYKRNNITLIENARAAELLPLKKQVVLSDGKTLEYTKLIYAAGADANRPPITGASGDNVFTIRTLKDIGALRTATQKAKKAVIIGGGVLGLETAWLIKKEGVDVTVVELAPILLNGRIDKESAKTVLNAAKRSGVEIALNAKTEAITEKGVKTDGGFIESDIVIISAGIRPYSELAEKAGLNCARGVIVDRGMRTNISDIYACGDCAVVEGVNKKGLWGEARETGIIAGKNAVGENRQFNGYDAPLAFTAFEITLLSDGNKTVVKELSRV